MSGFTGQDELVAVFLIVVPIAAGVSLTAWAGGAARRHKLSPPLVRLIRIGITAVWVSMVVAGLAYIFGAPGIFSTLTVSAVGGIALTLALQTTLQNLIAGFLLVREGSLRLGDTVSISGIKGRVVALGLITVVLRLDDGSLAFVSNSNLLSGPLVNSTASHRLDGEY